jgi:hypothetical protein
VAGPLRRVSGQRFRPTMEAFRAAFAGRACLAALAWNGRTIGVFLLEFRARLPRDSIFVRMASLTATRS